MDEPTLLSPGLHAADPLTEYWLRQVVLRLRREIAWLWYERGLSPDPQPAGMPYGDPVQAALDRRRFWQDKERFFREDATARYLSDQLAAPPPGSPAEALAGSFTWLLGQAGSDRFTAFLLALALSAELDSAMGSVIAACLNDLGRTQPTLALAQRLWDAPEEALCAPPGVQFLFRTGVFQAPATGSADGAAISWDAPLLVPATVAVQLLFPDAGLPAELDLVHGDGVDLELDETPRLVAARLAQDRPAGLDGGLRLAPVLGERGGPHTATAAAVATAAGKRLVSYRGDLELLEDPRYLNALATVCWLRGVALMIDASGLPPGGPASPQHPAVRLVPARSIPLDLFLGLRERSQVPQLAARYLMPAIAVPEFPYARRLAFWQEALGGRGCGLERAIAEVARRFRYERDTIRSICDGLRGLPEPLTDHALVAACRAEMDLDIGDLAQPVTPRFRDEKLILPEKQARQFEEVARAMRALTEVHYGWGTARVWNEGGIAALFAGPPGAGKTMAAEMLAQQLDLPMYRIDLSQVVNKYIGETEKNLKRLFDAAERADLLLFFDEADALFGRRTEVKDAHDRYANLEISYLLERMERFKGLAILATNRKRDLDEAFLRRLRFVIDFPMPEEPQRKAIWQQVIPPGVDAADVDFDFLARQFQLTGGHIRSIVFGACLQSAGNGAPRLEMVPVIAAVKREYDKLGRQVSLEHFGPYRADVEALEGNHGAR